MGTINVSDVVMKEIEIVNRATGLPVSGFTLYHYNHSIRSELVSIDESEYQQYASSSSYDEERGIYTIALPENMNADVWASLDLDNDGDNDFITELTDYTDRFSLSPWGSLSRLHISSGELDNLGVLFVDALPEIDTSITDLQVRVSLFDQQSNVLIDAPLAINDGLNGILNASYDVETQQYVFDSKIEKSLTIYLPAFTIGEQDYKANYLNIEKVSNDEFKVSYLGSWSEEYSIVSSDISALNFVLTAYQAAAETADVEVLLRKQVNDNYQVFYSQAVEIAEGDTTLVQKNKYQIIYGNADANDGVSAGTTQVSVSDVMLAHQVTADLNDTRMTLVPEQALEAGYSYDFLIENVTESATGIHVNLSDNNSFTKAATPLNSDFNIEMLALDNKNYFKHGARITATNTAGQASSTIEAAGPVYLIAAMGSLELLESLTIELVSYVNNGVSHLDNNSQYQIVVNGHIYYYVNKYLSVEVAKNEYVQSNGVSVYSGLASGNGYQNIFNRSCTGYNHLKDNSSTNENTMTFNYSFETKAGVTESGTVTLPVQ